MAKPASLRIMANSGRDNIPLDICTYNIIFRSIRIFFCSLTLSEVDVTNWHLAIPGHYFYFIYWFAPIESATTIIEVEPK